MEDLKVGDILKNGRAPCGKKNGRSLWSVWFVSWGLHLDLPRFDSGLAYLSDTGS